MKEKMYDANLSSNKIPSSAPPLPPGWKPSENNGNSEKPSSGATQKNNQPKKHVPSEPQSAQSGNGNLQKQPAKKNSTSQEIQTTEPEGNAPVLIHTSVGISKVTALKYSIATLSLLASSVVARIYTYLVISATLSAPVLFAAISVVSSLVTLGSTIYLISSFVSAVNSKKKVDFSKRELKDNASFPPPPPPLSPLVDTEKTRSVESIDQSGPKEDLQNELTKKLTGINNRRKGEEIVHNTDNCVTGTQQIPHATAPPLPQGAVPPPPPPPPPVYQNSPTQPIGTALPAEPKNGDGRGALLKAIIGANGKPQKKRQNGLGSSTQKGDKQLGLIDDCAP